MVRLHRLVDFESDVPVETDPPIYFRSPEKIQSSLKRICNAWVSYLQDYLNQTAELFKTPERPWSCGERTLVSSLAAAISQHFEKSLAVEECLVPKKKGRPPRGRCDLWVSIPDQSHDGGRFNFYLEAKKSKFEGAPDRLSAFLSDRLGWSRLLRDFKKGRKQKGPLSPYRNIQDREHQHYVIGMLVTPLEARQTDSKMIKETLRKFFQHGQPIQLRWKGNQKVKIDFLQWPTVAVAVLPDDGKTGMLAIFTALGSSRELLAKQERAKGMV